MKYRKFREYVDIIEWIENITYNSLIWRFPCYKATIKNGAQLKVGKTQMVVLYCDGQFADMYQPGHYNLTPENMPVLATLKRWKHGFSGPFKADIYFANTSHFWNVHWATIDTIVMNDPEFETIRLHASGVYCFKIKNPSKFIRNLMRNNNDFSKESVSNQMLHFAIKKFTDYINISRITVSELVLNLDEFSGELTIALKNDFEECGLELTNFSVRKIILPEDVKKIIDKRTRKDIESNRSINTETFTNSLIQSSNNIQN